MIVILEMSAFFILKHSFFWTGDCSSCGDVNRKDAKVLGKDC